MKKLSIICIAFVLSLLVVLSGCSNNKGTKVFKYLKDTKEFADTSNDYDVSLTVNEDLTFVLNVSCDWDLKNYQAKGLGMVYIGCYETSFTTEWLGVTQNNTKYEHAIKLIGTNVEINGREEIFYLVATTTSKRSDSYMLTLVHNLDFKDYDSNLERIVKSYPSYTLHKK